MTQTEQLQALRDKIAAGEADYTDLMQSPFNKRKNGWHLWELIFWSQQPDDLRAIGAAIAFTEAVAPECLFALYSHNNSADVYLPHPSHVTHEAQHDSLAIALILATLDYLIKKGESDE